MIAFVGCGGAGGNIADEAVRKGFQGGAINFSEKEINSLENIEYRLEVMGSDGVGHDRSLAISLIQRNLEVIVNFFKENFSNPLIDIIIIPFATGGGSGSGIAPIIIDVLSNVMSDKVFIALPVIPDKSEAMVSQINCLQVFEELSKLNVAVLPVDNQKVKDSLKTNNRNLILQTANESVVNLIYKLSSYTNKGSRSGNFDKRDFINISQTRGIMNISEVDITNMSCNLTVDGISRSINESWDSSIFASIEYDYVTKSAIIIDASNSLLTDNLDYINLFNKFTNGMPLDLFEGRYSDNSGKILTVLSGLPICRGRLSEIEKIINDGQARVENILSSSNSSIFKSSSSNSIMQKSTSTIKGREMKNSNVMDILNKYRR